MSNPGFDETARYLLMVAYHFPPLVGSSGMQRTLRFAEQLPAHGWHPVILTVHPRAYEKTTDGAAEPALAFPVERAQAWDAARHLSIFGRYPRRLALPDRWASWRWDGVRQGMDLIKRFRPAAIWSTYPIATAHEIGLALATRSGLPWIADFRDPMAQDDYPEDEVQRNNYHRLESAVIARATRSVFVTPSAMKACQQAHPSHADRMRLIENGYEDAMRMVAAPEAPLNPGCLTLLHSGIVYPSERDPTHLFAALAQLKETHPDLFARLRVRFRGSVHETLLRQLVATHGLEVCVEILPMCPYTEAVEEMRAADALLVLQASNCNAQIPAKFYEYLACHRPMLVLADPAGDTSRAARSAGLTGLAPLDDPRAIQSLLSRFIESPDAFPPASSEIVDAAARSERTHALARLLNDVTSHTK